MDDDVETVAAEPGAGRASGSTTRVLDRPAPRSRRPHVVVVEPFALVAEAFGAAMRTVCRTRAVIAHRESTTGSLTEEVARGRSDVVLLDTDLGPFVDCAALVEQLVQREMAVVVLTNLVGDDAGRGECLRRGAVGAVRKDGGLAPVKAALEQALAHRPVIDPEEARQLIAAADCAGSGDLSLRARLARLTVRERDILEMLKAGRSAAEIARRGVVSEATVRTQIRSILAKLEVSSQVAAVAVGYRFS